MGSAASNLTRYMYTPNSRRLYSAHASDGCHQYIQVPARGGLDGSLSEVLIGDAAVYAIESLMADWSAAFFVCNESAFNLEGARGGHESAI